MKIECHPEFKIDEKKLRSLSKSTYDYIQYIKNHSAKSGNFDAIPLAIPIHSMMMINSYCQFLDHLKVSEANYTEKEIFESLYNAEALCSFAEIVLLEEVPKRTPALSSFFENIHMSKLFLFCFYGPYLDLMLEEKDSLKKYRKEIKKIVTISGIYGLSKIYRISEEYKEIIEEEKLPQSFDYSKEKDHGIFIHYYRLALLREDILEEIIGMHNYLSILNKLEPKVLEPEFSWFAIDGLESSLSKIKRELQSIGGRKTHSRKDELIKIAEDTWQAYKDLKIPVLKMAQKILKYDEDWCSKESKKVQISPSISTIINWLEQSSYKPEIVGRPPKIDFELIIK